MGDKEQAVTGIVVKGDDLEELRAAKARIDKLLGDGRHLDAAQSFQSLYRRYSEIAAKNGLPLMKHFTSGHKIKYTYAVNLETGDLVKL